MRHAITQFRHVMGPRLFVAFLLVSVAGCNRDETPPSAASSGLPATVQGTVSEVRTAEAPIRVEVTGQVAAASQATLSSQLRGTVQQLKVREGTAVTKGQTLATLDSRDLQANLARAEAELENARIHLARMEQLFTEESVAKQELDNASRAFKVAEAGHRSALAQLSHTVITAPFDGVITEKLVEVGELASPGQVLLKMEDPRRLRLEATVAEGDLRAITRGAKIPVTIDALGPAPLQGTISQLLPVGDPNTHTFLVKIDLPPTPGLKTGLFGRMQLDKGTSRTWVIPRSAVFERGQLTGVYVVGPDRIARLRWIKVGRTLDHIVEILSGLNAGERVLTEAARGTDGGPVQIIPGPDQALPPPQ